MKSFSVSAAAVLFCFSMSVAAEQPASKPDPMEQAAKSLKKNMRQRPSNQGLRRAADRIDDNRERFNDRRNDTASSNDRAPKAVGRVEKADRPDRIDRIDAQAIVDLPGRSELARGRRK